MLNPFKRHLRVVPFQQPISPARNNPAEFPRRPVLLPVKNDDGHSVGYDLGWVYIGEAATVALSRIAGGVR